MDTHFRRNLINELSGVRTPHLIGTVNSSGITNLAIFNSIVHIGANPPLLGFILRPLSGERHSYENIKATGYYTLNLINKSLLKRAHLCSGKFDKGVSEFIMAGIKPSFSKKHPAPYVAESPVQLGLKIEEEHIIKSNGTRLMIGRIIEINLSQDILDEKGHVDISKQQIMGVQGLDNYMTFSSKMNRLDRVSKTDVSF